MFLAHSVYYLMSPSMYSFIDHMCVESLKGISSAASFARYTRRPSVGPWPIPTVPATWAGLLSEASGREGGAAAPPRKKRARVATDTWNPRTDLLLHAIARFCSLRHFTGPRTPGPRSRATGRSGGPGWPQRDVSLWIPQRDPQEVQHGIDLVHAEARQRALSKYVAASCAPRVRGRVPLTAFDKRQVSTRDGHPSAPRTGAGACRKGDAGQAAIFLSRHEGGGHEMVYIGLHIGRHHLCRAWGRRGERAANEAAVL